MSKKEIHKNLVVLPFATYDKWLKWLDKNYTQTDGIWIKFAKKKSGIKSITYEEAREVAIIYGWIDGLINGYDDQYYLTKFTPRRPKSNWSKINREIAENLIRQKKMKPTGKAEVDAAKKDGRWQAAYDSQSALELPGEIKKHFKKKPKHKKFFESISKANRYAFIYKIQNAKRPATREKHVNKMIEMLELEQTYHPEREKKLAKKKANKKKAGSKKSAKSIRMVALLRGINVGGKNKLKMAELRESLTKAGLKNVVTYIQSGNILFDSAATSSGLETKIKNRIKKDFGLDIPVMVRSAKFFKDAVKTNPFPNADPATMSLTVLSKKVHAKAVAIVDHEKYLPDYFAIKADRVFIVCPNGYARTKLNHGMFEKAFQCQATNRNWKTINKIIELAEER